MKERKIIIKIFLILLGFILTPLIFPKIGNINLLSIKYAEAYFNKNNLPHATSSIHINVNTGEDLIINEPGEGQYLRYYIYEGENIYSSQRIAAKPGTLELIHYTGNAKVFEVPEKSNTILSKIDTVTSIGEDAFKGNPNLETIIIPETIKDIQANAFYSLTINNRWQEKPNLKNIYIYAKEFNWNAAPSQFGIRIEEITIYCHKGTQGEKYAKAAGFTKIKYLDNNNKPIEVKVNTTPVNAVIKDAKKDNKEDTKQTKVTAGAQSGSKVTQTTNQNNKNQNNTNQNNKNQNNTSQNNKTNNTKTQATQINADTELPNITYSTTNGKNVVTLRWNATDNKGISGYKLVQQAGAQNTSGYVLFNPAVKKTDQITNELRSNGSWYLYVKDTSNNCRCIKIDVQGIDYTPPTIENVNKKKIQNGKYVELSWTAKDNSSGVNYYKIYKEKDGSVIKEKYYDNNYLEKSDSWFISENDTYIIYVEDAVGNTRSLYIGIDEIDITPPEITSFKILPENGEYAKKATIQWYAKDSGCGLLGWRISKVYNLEAGSMEQYYSEPTTEKKLAQKTLKENGTYYLYVVDKNLNIKYKRFTINNIDTVAPVFSTKPKVNYFGNYAEISYRAIDQQSGVKSYKLDGYSGTKNYYDKDGKEISLKQTGLQKIKVTKDGTYKLILKDAAGNQTVSEEIKITGIDSENPKFTSLKVISNTGNTVNGVNYIKKDSKIKFELQFNEDVTIDKSKITVNGMIIKDNTIEITKINSKKYHLTLIGNIVSPNNKDGSVEINLSKEFAKDKAGNFLKNERVINKIILDNNAPKVDAKYESVNKEEDHIFATITDKSKIDKLQWKVLDVDTKEVVKEFDMKNNINKSSINEKDNVLKLRKYKGYIVSLYVEDILGNSNTTEIMPPISYNYELVTREGNELTYRITMNLRAKLDSTKSNPGYLKKFLDDNVKNYNIITLEPEEGDTTGRKFILKVQTDGVEKDGHLKMPKGTIYVKQTFDTNEIAIDILFDNTAPQIVVKDIPENKVKKINLSSIFTDTGSGLSKYNYVLKEKNIVKKNITENLDATRHEFYTEITDNCSLSLTVWDKQGNSNSNTIKIDNIDSIPPVINKITYSKPDENRNVTVTIETNEKVTSDDWNNLNERTITKVYKETDLRGINLNIPDVVIKDEAGNILTVKLEDKIAPEIIGEVELTSDENGNKSAKIEFNEEIQDNEEIQILGWKVSSNGKILTKNNIKFNESLYVKDLAGNTIDKSIEIKVEDEQGEVNPSLFLGRVEKNKWYDLEIDFGKPVERVELLSLKTKNDASYTLSEDNTKIQIKYFSKSPIDDRIIMIEPNGRMTYYFILINYIMYGNNDFVYEYPIMSVEQGDNQILSYGCKNIKSFEGTLCYDHNELELVEIEENNGWKIDINSDKIEAKLVEGQNYEFKLKIKFRFKYNGKLVNTDISINDIKVETSGGDIKSLSSKIVNVNNSKLVDENQIYVDEKIGFSEEKVDNSLVEYLADDNEQDKNQSLYNISDISTEDKEDDLDSQKNNLIPGDGQSDIRIDNDIHAIAAEVLYANVSEYYINNDDENEISDESNEENFEQDGEAKQTKKVLTIIIITIITIILLSIVSVTIILILKNKNNNKTF